MGDPPQRDPSPGRPLDPAADEAILSATLAILAESGHAGLTMDAIATRGGVSKATIYRRWASKEEVVLAAVERLSQRVPVPDTGTLQGDLTAIADALTGVFSAPDMTRLVSAIVAQMAVDPALADAMRRGFLADRRAAAREVLERARGSGQVRAEIDLEAAVDLVAAPFYYRLLITGEAIDEPFAHSVIDAVTTWVTRR